MSLALLQSLGGCAASCEWTVGDTPKNYKRRPVPFGARRFKPTDPNLPPKAAQLFESRPRVKSCICIV